MLGRHAPVSSLNRRSAQNANRPYAIVLSIDVKLSVASCQLSEYSDNSNYSNKSKNR